MITKEQHQALFEFCERHRVRYYETQVELVDHLASAVEEEMVVHPDLTFEKALDQVYAGFGVRGFGPFIDSKESQVLEALKTAYKRQRIRALTAKPIFAGLLFGAITYYLLHRRSLYPLLILTGIFILILLWDQVKIIRWKRKLKNSKVKFLSAKFLRPYGGSFIYLLLFFRIAWPWFPVAFLEWLVASLFGIFFIRYYINSRATYEVYQIVRRNHPAFVDRYSNR